MIDQIKEIIVDVTSVDPTSLELATAIEAVPNWDSMAHITIITSVEEEFDISFEPEEMISIKTLGDIVSLVETKKQ